jgi:hypothetical protein
MTVFTWQMDSLLSVGQVTQAELAGSLIDEIALIRVKAKAATLLGFCTLEESLPSFLCRCSEGCASKALWYPDVAPLSMEGNTFFPQGASSLRSHHLSIARHGNAVAYKFFLQQLPWQNKAAVNSPSKKWVIGLWASYTAESQ